MRLLALLLAMLPCLGGCAIDLFDWWPEGSTESAEYSKIDKPRLWEEVKEVVNKHWRMKEIDEEDLFIESEWDEHLGPMYKSGLRRQCNVWVHDGERGPFLEVQVLKEINTNIKRPLDSYAATWEPDGRDIAQEQRIIVEVELSLGLFKESDSAGKKKPSPYLKEEDEAARRRRLWD
ncbi:MAG: hypothetical protein ACYTGX_11770 [Planctomycetota bacterium]|jgi:hypothetical protein